MNNSVTLLDIQDKIDALANNLNASFTQITEEKMEELQAKIETLEVDLRTELGEEIIYNIALNNNSQGFYQCDVYKFYINEENYQQRFYKTPIPYRVGSNNLIVHYAGLLMSKGEDEDYIEVDENTIRFNYDLQIGLRLEFQITNAITTELRLFELPIASDVKKGIVKQGENISIAKDGTISAVIKNIPNAEILVDSNHRFVTDNQMKRWDDTYTKNEVDFMVTSFGHPIAEKNKVGLVKPGKNLEVQFDGTLNVIVDQYIDPRAIEENDQYQFITTYERELITVIPNIMEKLGVPYPEFETDPDDYQLINAEERALIHEVPKIMNILKDFAHQISILNGRVGIPNSDIVNKLIK